MVCAWSSGDVSEGNGAGERAETYPELRQRYGVDNADAGASGSGNLIMVRSEVATGYR
jgi:hypothetical protein